MKFALALASFLVLCAAVSALPQQVKWERILEAHRRVKPAGENHWVVLVAGSNGWYNYRHQADICHAYQLVKKHGVPEDQIITMMYDDIAQNPSNPTKGIIINRPNGTDVYKGIKIDYKKNQVTPTNFLNVLQGKGSGKVLKSGPNDVVFVNFADHGGVGLLGFPNDVLSVKSLQTALKYMHDNKMYKKMVIYVEACESGSMFEGVLPDNVKVYVTTASNAKESSYACYYDKKRSTYLGDFYSVRWMEDSDAENLNLETLEKQFTLVKKEVNSSHCMQYGDLSIGKDKVGEYQGTLNTPKQRLPKIKITDAVSSRDVPYTILKNRLRTATSVEEQESIQTELVLLIKKQQKINAVFDEIIRLSFGAENSLLNYIKTERAALKNLDCHHDAVTAIHQKCFNLGQTEEALQHMYKIANLCENHVPTKVIISAIQSTCAGLTL